ncbi:MAG TPA: class I SAM-dependent methyltransferase [Stellaceae bacterium]|nr:class I SAM-dependent methyltransferase [Stellaceae bacterium]
MTLFGRNQGDTGAMPLSERLYRRFFLEYHGRYLITELQLRARQQSVDYIQAEMEDAAIFADRWALLRYSAGQAPPEGMMIECGVADGGSLRHLATDSVRRFHGFDSFEARPESWAGIFGQRSKFNSGGSLPDVPGNVVLHKGAYEQTLPPFLAAHADESVAFLHIDCGIYSASVLVLRTLAPRLKPGAVLVFEEYFNHPNWQRHEWRAFQEFIRDTGLSYRYLGFAQKNGHVALRLGEESDAGAREAERRLEEWGLPEMGAR